MPVGGGSTVSGLSTCSLKVMSGGDESHLWQQRFITSNNSLIIGSRTSDFNLPNYTVNEVKPIHGEILYTNGSWSYKHEDGTTTLVDPWNSKKDEQCEIEQIYPIKDDMTLKLGINVKLGDDDLEPIEIQIKINLCNDLVRDIISKEAQITCSQKKILLKVQGGNDDLGLEFQSINNYFIVTRVDPDSPAEEAGILYSDTLLTINDEPIEKLGESGLRVTTKDIKRRITELRDPGNIVELVFHRPVSEEHVVGQLKKQVTDLLTKTRESFGAESKEYKKTKAQSIIEIKELEKIQQQKFIRHPNLGYFRIPYHPMIPSQNMLGVKGKLPFRSTKSIVHPMDNRQHDKRLTAVWIGAEEMLSLKFGLKSKWQPRHCVVKSCGSSLIAKGLKPGSVVRAIDMMRCPPSGGPKQDGNAQDVVEARMREQNMNQRQTMVFVENPNYCRDCFKYCCPLTWMYECISVEGKERQRSRQVVLDDCLCCCNCFCNIMEEDLNCCHSARKECCNGWCVSCTCRIGCCPLMCATIPLFGLAGLAAVMK